MAQATVLRITDDNKVQTYRVKDRGRPEQLGEMLLTVAGNEADQIGLWEGWSSSGEGEVWTYPDLSMVEQSKTGWLYIWSEAISSWMFKPEGMNAWVPLSARTLDAWKNKSNLTSWVEFRSAWPTWQLRDVRDVRGLVSEPADTPLQAELRQIIRECRGELRELGNKWQRAADQLQSIDGEMHRLSEERARLETMLTVCQSETDALYCRISILSSVLSGAEPIESVRHCKMCGTQLEGQTHPVCPKCLAVAEATAAERLAAMSVRATASDPRCTICGEEMCAPPEQKDLVCLRCSARDDICANCGSALADAATGDALCASCKQWETRGLEPPDPKFRQRQVADLELAGFKQEGPNEWYKGHVSTGLVCVQINNSDAPDCGREAQFVRLRVIVPARHDPELQLISLTAPDVREAIRESYEDLQKQLEMHKTVKDIAVTLGRIV